MNPRYFLLFFSFVFLAANAQAESRTNILFIHMEDMGVQIPAYGDDTVSTPNLDQFAAEGIVFERAHVTAATCAASRGTLFSGLYPHQNGIMGFVSQHGFHYRDGVPTFIRDLKKAGYTTGLTYKTGVESSHYKIARWPGQVKNPGSRSDALVSFVDLYPSFVDAAGLEIPNHLPGYSILPVLKGEASPRKHLYSAYVAHTTGMHQYWPSRTVTDGRWKLTHHVLGDGKHQRYPEGNKAVFSLNKQIDALPADALARQLRQRCEVPPAFELYDLQNDPDEHQNLIGNPEHTEIEKRLKTQLKNWRRQCSDPFLDDSFLTRFNQTYRKNYELWKSLGGDQMKDKGALDFEAFIPAWDPAPYLGRKDT